MVPLLPKTSQVSTLGNSASSKANNATKTAIAEPNTHAIAPEISSVDSESLLNKFLVKNDLKFLENYLSLPDMCMSNSATEDSQSNPAFSNTLLFTPSLLLLAKKLSLEDGSSNSPDSSIYRRLKKPLFGNNDRTRFNANSSCANKQALTPVSPANKSVFDSLVYGLQKSLNPSPALLSQFAATHALLHNSSSANNDSEHETDHEHDTDLEHYGLNAEVYVRSNDLLLYFKIFNSFVTCFSRNIDPASFLATSSPVASGVLRLFNAIVSFSSKLPSGATQASANTDIDSFNYDSLKSDSQHLLFETELRSLSKSAPFEEELHPDIESLLVHLVIKNYECLSSKNFNYLMYLMGGFRPENVYLSQEEAAGGFLAKTTKKNKEKDTNGSESFKKLKSCSRCRKNKVKCDSALKFPYSCSNCFKKNINLMRIYVKRMAVSCHEVPGQTVEAEDEDVSVDDRNGNNSNDYYSLFDPAKMTRSSSTMTSSSSTTTASHQNLLSLSPASAPSSTSSCISSPSRKPECGCGSQSCLSGLNQPLSQKNDDIHSNPTLTAFLNLFNIDASGQPVPAKLSKTNSSLIPCEVQLISSNLVLRKQSLMKNNLIKTLKKDIVDLKQQINAMILKEEKQIALLNEQEHLVTPMYNNQQALDLFHKVRQDTARAQEKTVSKKRNLAIISTNELLILNGMSPVYAPSSSENPQASKRQKKYLETLGKQWKAHNAPKITTEAELLANLIAPMLD